MRALVTGANRGIGRATALALARDGYDLVLHYRAHAGEAEEVARAVRTLGRSAELVAADLAKPTEVERLADLVLEDPAPLDALVHNAGEYPRTGLSEATPEAFRAILEVHAVAPLELTRRLSERLAAASPGRVVFVSSVLATLGSARGAPYAAAKAAQLGLVRSLARELAPRVRVNAVAPGSIDTAILAGDSPPQRADRIRAVPLGRLGTPEDIASAIAFLVSPASSYLTGATVPVNGGTAFA